MENMNIRTEDETSTFLKLLFESDHPSVGSVLGSDDVIGRNKPEMVVNIYSVIKDLRTWPRAKFSYFRGVLK